MFLNVFVQVKRFYYLYYEFSPLTNIKGIEPFPSGKPEMIASPRKFQKNLAALSDRAPIAMYIAVFSL